MRLYFYLLDLFGNNDYKIINKFYQKYLFIICPNFKKFHQKK